MFIQKPSFSDKQKGIHYFLHNEKIIKKGTIVPGISLMQQLHIYYIPQITITVYNMASVDFNTFFSAFVVHFLQNMDGLDNDQRTTLKENFKTDTVSIYYFLEENHFFLCFLAEHILFIIRIRMNCEKLIIAGLDLIIVETDH